MATTCPPANRCDASFPGWLSNGHPTVAEGIVKRTVCFNNFCTLLRKVALHSCKEMRLLLHLQVGRSNKLHVPLLWNRLSSLQMTSDILVCCIAVYFYESCSILATRRASQNTNDE